MRGFKVLWSYNFLVQFDANLMCHVGRLRLKYSLKHVLRLLLTLIDHQFLMWFLILVLFIFIDFFFFQVSNFVTQVWLI